MHAWIAVDTTRSTLTTTVMAKCKGAARAIAAAELGLPKGRVSVRMIVSPAI